MWVDSNRARGARRGTKLTTLACVALLAAVSLSVARATPTASKAPTYHFSSCSGPSGTPQAFDGTKQSQGAVFRLVGQSGDIVVVSATDPTSGTTVFSTPGFSQNGRPTITCSSTSPVSGLPARVTGFFAPST
jgi:hypothetical protein